MAAHGGIMAEPLEDAVESHDKKVALIIAILALFLAFAEAGAKNAEHHSTEVNIERSDDFAFYQSKKVRQTVVETAAQAAEALAGDPRSPALDKQIGVWKDMVAKFEKDPKSPQDSLDNLLEQAKKAEEERDFANRKLEHFEYASGALQIAIVLASAAIITGMTILAWVAGGLGLIGALLAVFGYFGPSILPFFGG